MSYLNMKNQLKNDKVHIKLSLPYSELSNHLTNMLNLQCHLIWIHTIVVNKINYFNLLWVFDDQITNTKKEDNENFVQENITPNIKNDNDNLVSANQGKIEKCRLHTE